MLRVVALSVTMAAIALVPLMWDRRPTYRSVDEIASVDQIVDDPVRWQGVMAAVRGIVRPGSIERSAGTEWRFDIVGQDQTLNVHYTGVVPSTFGDGADVVVFGHLGNQQFSAGTLLVHAPDWPRIDAVERPTPD